MQYRQLRMLPSFHHSKSFHGVIGLKGVAVAGRRLGCSRAARARRRRRREVAGVAGQCGKQRLQLASWRRITAALQQRADQRLSGSQGVRRTGGGRRVLLPCVPARWGQRRQPLQQRLRRGQLQHGRRCGRPRRGVGEQPVGGRETGRRHGTVASPILAGWQAGPGCTRRAPSALPPAPPACARARVRAHQGQSCVRSAMQG